MPLSSTSASADAVYPGRCVRSPSTRDFIAAAPIPSTYRMPSPCLALAERMSSLCGTHHDGDAARGQPFVGTDPCAREEEREVREEGEAGGTKRCAS